MISYCVLASDIIEFKGQHFSKFPRKTNYLSSGFSKLKDTHPVNHFPGFLGKIIENCPPSKLFLFISLLRFSVWRNRFMYMRGRQSFLNPRANEAIVMLCMPSQLFDVRNQHQGSGPNGFLCVENQSLTCHLALKILKKFLNSTQLNLDIVHPFIGFPILGINCIALWDLERMRVLWRTVNRLGWSAAALFQIACDDL